MKKSLNVRHSHMLSNQNLFDHLRRIHDLHMFFVKRMFTLDSIFSYFGRYFVVSKNTMIFNMTSWATNVFLSWRDCPLKIKKLWIRLQKREYMSGMPPILVMLAVDHESVRVNSFALWTIQLKFNVTTVLVDTITITHFKIFFIKECT